MQALTMRELRKCNVDIACLSEVRIPNSGHSVIKVPGKEACYHLYHSRVVDNTGKETRKHCQMLKSVSRRLAGLGEVLFERDGSVIPDQARKPCRWEEHFKELLNHAAPPNTVFSSPDTSAAESYLCEVDRPTLEEACTAIRQLHNNGAPGEGSIPGEVNKTCLDSLVAASGDCQSLVM